MLQNELVRQLARASARGHRQMGLVNELLTGEKVAVVPIWVPRNQYGGSQQVLSFGISRVSYASYRALRDRLQMNGFIVEEHDKWIRLHYKLEVAQ